MLRVTAGTGWERRVSGVEGGGGVKAGSSCWSRALSEEYSNIRRDEWTRVNDRCLEVCRATLKKWCDWRPSRKVYFVRYNGHEWTWIAAHHTRFCNAGDVCCRRLLLPAHGVHSIVWKLNLKRFPEFTVFPSWRSERLEKSPWDSVPGWTKKLKKSFVDGNRRP